MLKKSVLSLLDEPDKIQVRSTLCGHTYSNKFDCTLCVDNCPTNSLVWSGNKWVVEDCNRCGKCVSICPSHVFKLDEDKLMKKYQLNKEVLLTCDVLLEGVEDSFAGPVVSISCLNQLYPELFLYLLAKQKRINIYLDSEKCSQCHEFKFENLMDEILEIGDFRERINWIKNLEDLRDLVLENEEKSMNRREFFGSMFRRGQKASLEVINETIADFNKLFDDGSNKNNARLKEKSEKRLRLLMALQLFNQQNISHEITDLPYRYIQVDKCEFCGICAKVCPSGALEIKESEGKKSLHYWPLKCTSCGLCQDVCRLVGEISWGQNMRVEDLMKNKKDIVLAAAKASNCDVCGEEIFFYPDDQEFTCYGCRLRSKTPEDINPFKRWKSHIS